ncbi:hypothetical protein M9Y10_017651 [Tritrichomonas musculus]|uniref:AB hydrolase-1 domain-containing protein n=1 Tax=Tritrichomonas musculus TaxID=1915356 RepID=A0ABR2HUF9_9EUKA
MIIEVIVTLFILFICFCIYRKSIKYYPTVYVNPEGSIAHVISQTKSLSQPYKPTWWLFNRHLQTIRGMRFRKSSKLINSVRRELITYSDGGTSALDWFETDSMKNDTPILFIIHTYGGGTREPVSNNMAEAGVKNGWRTVIFNNRCCSGAPITSSRMIACEYNDIEFAMNHVREEFKPKFVFIVGFSLGGFQMIEYLMRGKVADAAACVSHTYDPVPAELLLHKPLESVLYQKVMMAKLTHLVKKNPYLDNPAAANAKTLIQYDDALWCHGLSRFKSGEELYQSLNIYDKIPKIQVPMILIGSCDDPFTLKEYMPIDDVKKSDNIALISFPEGGHVSFIRGDDGNKSILDTIIPDWFNSIMKDKEKNN